MSQETGLLDRWPEGGPKQLWFSLEVAVRSEGAVQRKGISAGSVLHRKRLCHRVRLVGHSAKTSNLGDWMHIPP